MALATIIVDFDKGTSIRAAAKESGRIANYIGARIKFNFNGINCYIDPGHDYRSLVTAYHYSIKNDLAYAESQIM